MTSFYQKRCVLYARISVTKEESVSVERQLESCRKHAESRGWEVVGEFVDDGVSATSNRPEDREGWSRMMRVPDFQAVVIWKVDRLARKVLDFLHVDETLRERGAGLVAVEDPIDMTTPMGRAFATILAVFGEMEAAAISARIRAARTHLEKSGRFAGGAVRYGLMAADNPKGPGRVLVIDPERIDWLREIVRRGMAGESVGSIVRHLDTHRAPLPHIPRARRSDESWNRQTVENILRNPAIAGDGTLAVITADEFQELQKVLDSRNTPQAAKMADRQRTSPLLSRLAVCDECDRFLCRGTNQKRPTLYCPQCRQTLSRSTFDQWLIQRLLTERGHIQHDWATVAECWRTARGDEDRRAILAEQIDALRVRRGIVGKRFDESRIILTWAEPQEVAA